MYDYQLDDAGITELDVDDDVEDEIRGRKVPRDLAI